MTSCKSKNVIVQKEAITETITEKVHDTVFSVAKDSSFYKAFLECQNGKVVLKEVTSTGSGRKLKTPKVTIKNNLLNVDCETEAEKLFASWKETFKKTYSKIEIPIITNELTWFQKSQIYFGRTALFILCLYLLYLLFKFKKI